MAPVQRNNKHARLNKPHASSERDKDSPVGGSPCPEVSEVEINKRFSNEHTFEAKSARNRTLARR